MSKPLLLFYLIPSLWTRIFSYLPINDLKSVVSTCKTLSVAGKTQIMYQIKSNVHNFQGKAPSLSWRTMQVRSRTVFMFGLEHFLRNPSYANVQHLDFSSTQLETFELRLMCEFCCKNRCLKSLDLRNLKKVLKRTPKKVLKRILRNMMTKSKL